MGPSSARCPAHSIGCIWLSVITVNCTCQLSGITHVTPFCKYGKHSTGPSTYRPWVRTYSKLFSCKSSLTVCSYRALSNEICTYGRVSLGLYPRVCRCGLLYLRTVEYDHSIPREWGSRGQVAGLVVASTVLLVYHCCHGSLARYVKLRRECWERFPRPPQVSDPDMHHGTCVTHVPWCMPGLLTSGFLWSWWRGNHSRHSRRMCKPDFHVSGKRPMMDRLEGGGGGGWG